MLCTKEFTGMRIGSFFSGIVWIEIAVKLQLSTVALKAMGGESALVFSAIVRIETAVILQFSTVCTKESSGRRLDFCFQCNSPKWNCSYIAALDCFAQKKAVERESALVLSAIVRIVTALILQISVVLCTKEFSGMRIGSCFQYNRPNWNCTYIPAFDCALH